MNILIPHSWLLEHLETSASEAEIQKFLSLSGPSVERIHEIEGESVYDIEVTTNRVDSMSVRGIAREAAVILTEAGIPSTLKPLQLSALQSQTSENKPLPEIVNNSELCKRIICQVVSNVEKRPSPEWMQKRLKQIGVNVHDSVIDITNYITHELGHPCHAFDYDKVMATGGKIIVKIAEAGKKFAIIDGTEFTTVGGEIVFENEQGEIIDLPAIKGTANTSIGDETKNVLFWLETLDPKKVRFASMTHAIRTVAAQLSEKNVDPHLAEDILKRGVELLTELTGGQIASEVYDDFPGKKSLQSVEVKHSTILQYLGVEIKPSQIQSILENLGCTVELGEQNYIVTPPTFRPDLQIPADIVEEVARIYGYHNLPSTLMTGEIPTIRNRDNFDLEHMVKEFWATLGGYEVYTYSLINKAQSELESRYVLSGFSESATDIEQTHIKLKNPLTDDLVYLRRTLWSQHLTVLEKNPQHKELAVFEFANVYLPSEMGREVDKTYRSQSASRDKDSSILPYEEFHLTLTARGDQRYLKGMVEALFQKLHFPKLKYVPTKNNSEVELKAGDNVLGHMIFIPDTEVIVFDIDWRTVIQYAKTYPAVQSELKFTPIIEDLTFKIPKTEHVQRVIETIQSVPSIYSVNLKDLYQYNGTATIQMYSPDKQLNAEDASVIRSNIVKTVEEIHQASLVGELK